MRDRFLRVNSSYNQCDLFLIPYTSKAVNFLEATVNTHLTVSSLFSSIQFFHFPQTLISGFGLKIANSNHKHTLHGGIRTHVFTLFFIQLRLYFKLSFLTKVVWPVFNSLTDDVQRNLLIPSSNLAIASVLFCDLPASPVITSLWFPDLLSRINCFLEKEQLVYHSITVVKFDKYLVRELPTALFRPF